MDFLVCSYDTTMTPFCILVFVTLLFHIGTHGWEGPRKLLGIHALTSSFLNELKKELFQQQLIQFVSSDFVVMIISSKLETKITWAEHHHVFQYILLATVIYSFAEIYSQKPLNKLSTIPSFVGMERQIKIIVATVFAVFFRAVENAI